MNMMQLELNMKRLKFQQERMDELKLMDKRLRSRDRLLNIEVLDENRHFKTIKVIGDKATQSENWGLQRGLEMVHLGLLKWCAQEMEETARKIGELSDEITQMLNTNPSRA